MTYNYAFLERMKKTLLLLILFSNLGFLQAQENPGTIRGIIHDKATGEPVIYAKVIILDLDSVMVGGAFSDYDGLFSVPQISPGTYNVQVLEISHETEIMSDVELKSNGIVTLKVLLKEKEQIQAPVLINGIQCGGPIISRDG